MSCQHYVGEINALVDGTLDRVERREIEDHLAVCESCRALAADLQGVRELGGRLERLTPPPALWDRISDDICREPRKRPLLRQVVWMPLAAAAVLALAIGFTAWRQEPAAPSGAASGPGQTAVDLANSVEEELRLAAQHYENAIVGLERLARDRQQLLDPQVAATLHRNLQVIDTAISESRAALQAQPTNDSAQQSLFDAFRTKIALLEDTITLLNELRQSGQPAQTGAAAGGSSL